MTRPTILDLDLVVVPRDTGDAFANSSLPKEMIDAGYDVLEQCDVDLMNGAGPDWDYGMEAVATYRSMLSASPYPTAWDDVRKYVEGLENNWTDDDRARAWRESFDSMHQRAMAAEARIAVLEKLIDALQKSSDQFERKMNEIAVERNNLWDSERSAKIRAAELEKRLADAERVIEPFAAVEPMNVWHETEEDEGYHSLTENQFRAARAYMEGAANE